MDIFWKILLEYLTVVRAEVFMEEKEYTQEKMNTKENIELIALNLFSKRGFHAVSIRDMVSYSFMVKILGSPQDSVVGEKKDCHG